MAGEQILATGVPIEALPDEPLDSIEGLKWLVAHGAAECAKQWYKRNANGNIPVDRFTLLYPVGSELRKQVGNDEPVKVELAVGVNFGKKEATDSITHCSQSQDLEQRFSSVSKVVLLPDEKHSVGVGTLPDGGETRGLPVAAYAFGPTDFGVSGNQELQSHLESNYLYCMGVLVAAAATDGQSQPNSGQEQPSLQDLFGLLEDSATSLRTV